MSEQYSQQQLESYLWGAATLLRGTIDAGDYKQFIFPLLFYKRLCDVFDEETAAALDESGGDEQFAGYPENHRFQISPEAHWRELRSVSRDVGRAIQHALRAIETANPDQLFRIFGDAQWTNKDRLSDAMLRDLIQHFSTLDLTLENLPEDELGRGYEYLIKKFADDSGHTAAEFYTNRTVVQLMTELLQPQPGESIYDPTCGTGGMLLSAIAHLKRRGLEWRNVRLYGQERNLMTSAIARMNLFLHGVEDFRIERGDTLSEPKFVEADRLQRSDLVLANPPYSIKQWDREAFAADPWGRNVYGTPPQGRADYAFWQHILRSLAPGSGRCAILFPHGVLFRQEEAEMRRRLVEADLIECVIGLGPNLFYNSPMEACVLICRAAKPRDRRNKVLFINAVNEVMRERAQSFLTEAHITRIAYAYAGFAEEPGFAHVASLDEIREQGGNLSIPLYVSPVASEARASGAGRGDSLSYTLTSWLDSRRSTIEALRKVLGEEIPAPATRAASAAALTWLDKGEWRDIPFGDFAQNVTERVEPADAQDEIYVGLEHIDPEDLHIRRWGQASDVIGTKLRFRNGDVIFGRRRAYQRKLAVADFDGICSAHAMVARAKPDFVLPEFLPFLMTSDHFMGRAVEISVGTLSPTINWKTLRVEKFALPPRDQQRRIAELLWSVDEAIEQLQVEAGRARLLRQANLEAAFSDLLNGPVSRLSDLLLRSPESGKSVPPSAEETGHYVLSLSALSGSGYVRGNLKPVRPSVEILRAQLTQGDLLVSRSNTQELVGLAGIFDENRNDISFPDTMMRLSIDEARVCKEYLEAFLLSRSGRLHMMRAAAGTSGSMKKINRQTLGTCVVPTPSLEDQLRLMDRISPLKEVTVAAEAAAMRVRVLRSAIIEAAMGIR